MSENASVSRLLPHLAGYGAGLALIREGETTTYAELVAAAELRRAELVASGLTGGKVVAVAGEADRATCALLLALIAERNVVVPLDPRLPAATLANRLATAQAHAVFLPDGAGGLRRDQLAPSPLHQLTAELVRRGEAGLVLFSSGSTGESKASLLSLDRLLRKFERPGRPFRTLAFLMLDHIGGLNTWLAIQTAGGTIVSSRERQVDAVCEAIACHRIQLLPTTPTFLRMLLISEAHLRHDLSSLELITYGTEPMPESTLAALHRAFPAVRLKQTYGLSELGILRTRSRASGSPWVKVGGEGFETKVVAGTLWIRAESAMLGYLNAPSPFEADGWLNTQDAVLVDGDYLRILGRASEIINVAGEKVFPAEVESVLLQMSNVLDATVRARPNPVTGAVVTATVSLAEPEAASDFTRRMREFCSGRLAPYQVPLLVEIAAQAVGPRFKKQRNVQSPAAHVAADIA